MYPSPPPLRSHVRTSRGTGVSHRGVTHRRPRSRARPVRRAVPRGGGVGAGEGGHAGTAVHPRPTATSYQADRPPDAPQLRGWALVRATAALVAGRSGQTPGIAVEFTRFVLVGGIDVAIQFAVFNVALLLGAPPLVATAAGMLLATTNSFVLHRNWTFGHRRTDRARRQVPLFALTDLIGMGITEGSVAVGSQLLHADGYLVLNAILVTGTCLAGLFRFLAYRRWVFATDPRRGATEPPTP